MPRGRGERKTIRLIRFYSLALILVVLDQFSKWYAMSRLLEGESIAVIPDVFHFTLVYNTGIAFGFFSHHENILMLLITLSVLVLFFLSSVLAGNRLPARIGFAMILGGAIGNWIDRLRYHAVIDFLDFRIWPVFNFADSVITIGVTIYLGMVICDSFHANKRTSVT